MTQISIQRRRTGFDIAWGILLIIGGLIVLGDVVIATVVTVLFLGWMALITGIVGVVASLFKIGKGGGFWSTLLTGALVGVLGLMILRHPEIGAGVITLMAGMVFLVAGIVRLIAGVQPVPGRWMLVVSGIAGIVLGLIVLFNPVQATFTLLGVLLGINLLVDGVTLILWGRVHVDVTSTPAG
jgi:uncharacterized membrane protein HdeD (DUF308 family)